MDVLFTGKLQSQIQLNVPFWNCRIKVVILFTHDIAINDRYNLAANFCATLIHKLLM